MKVADIIGKLPVKVKLTSGFTLDYSFDVNTILQFNHIAVESDDCGICYKIQVTAKSEDLEYNKSISIKDWLNPVTHEHELDYFEINAKHMSPNGDLIDTIYVMDDDDFFEIIEDKTKEKEITECAVETILDEMFKDYSNFKTDAEFQKLKSEYAKRIVKVFI